MSKAEHSEIGWVSVDPLATQRKETFSLYSESGSRTRKHHYKSRDGCNTCKKCRTKCDEKRPVCGSCKRKKLDCVYANSRVKTFPTGSKDTSLAPTLASLSALIEVQVLSALESADKLDVQLPNFAEVTRSFAMENMKHFVEHDGAWLKSNLVQKILQKETINLAIDNPYLLHAVLAVSAAHKARLTGSRQQWVTSMIHYQHTLVLFNRSVKDLQQQNIDALFAASILQGMMGFLNWPLSLNSIENQPEWIICIRGTHTFVRVPSVLETLHKSVWQAAIKENESWKLQAALSIDSRVQTPSSYITCALVSCWPAFSTSQREKFQNEAGQLILLDGQQATCVGIGGFTSFITDATPDFIQSVQDRDEVALVLVCCWCSIFSRIEQWWIPQRAISECRNIYKYLYPRVTEPRVLHALDTFVRYCHPQD